MRKAVVASNLTRGRDQVSKLKLTFVYIFTGVEELVVRAIVLVNCVLLSFHGGWI